ncbi:MAG: amidohydrolase family protein [Planctomycetes bacterium]|nr:amidohydrolase family protein [Planctomycetota bacterium]
MNPVTDTSVFSGQWPFRKLPYRTPGELKEHLSGRGVREAWVSSLDAILYPDPMHGNVPLAETVARDPFFVPVAVLDVTLAKWRRDARECLEQREFRALKLTPNYHSYPLTDPNAAALADLAGEAGVPVCIQTRMMDERAHHPLMKVPQVPASEIAALARRHPRTRFLACAADNGMLKAFAGIENLWSEISFVENRNTLFKAIGVVGASRLVFGTHSPLLYFEASAAKLDSDPEDVSAEQLETVCVKNATELLGARKK